jgi:peptide/nickel transport system substrate-binding protein
VLMALGLRPTLEVVPEERYFETIYGPRPGPPVRPAVYMSGWISDYPGGSNFIDAQFSCGASGNASGFCDRAIDGRIAEAKALQTTEPGAANRAWAAIERDLVERALWVSLTNPITTYAVSDGTENVQIHPQWGLLLSGLWVR